MGGGGDVSHLSLLDEKVEGTECLFLRDLEIGAVKEIDVDIICSEPPQAMLATLEDMMPRIPSVVRPGARPHEDLARDENILPLPSSLEGLTEDSLAFASCVNVRAVEEIDAGIQGSVNDLKRFFP